MAETGILNFDARVALTDGEIIDMASIGSTHASYVNRLTWALVQSVGDGALVSVQSTVILGGLLEPDFALFKPKVNDYESSLPSVEDILLLIEVENITIKYDTQKTSITVFVKPVEGLYTEIKTSPLPINIPTILLSNIKLKLK